MTLFELPYRDFFQEIVLILIVLILYEPMLLNEIYNICFFPIWCRTQTLRNFVLFFLARITIEQALQ